MLGIVLPGAVSAGIDVLSVVDVLPVVIAVGVVYEVVVVVDYDVVVAATPSGIPAATSTPGSSHRDTDAE